MTSFVYFYTHLSPPFEAVAAQLAGEPTAWLPEPARPDADDVRVDLHADGALPAAVETAPVRVQVGSVTADEDQLRLPVRWTAAVADWCFPHLTGELELHRLAGSGCRLSLVGTYQPPGGPLGEIADRVAGHRVAEACARRFVLDVGARLTAAASDAHGRVAGERESQPERAQF